MNRGDLKLALRHIRRKDLHQAINMLRRHPGDPYRDFLLAIALAETTKADSELHPNWAADALNLLVPLLFSEHNAAMNRRHRKLAFNLARCAAEYISRTQATGIAGSRGKETYDVLRHFYLGLPGQLHGKSAGEKALATKTTMATQLRIERTISPDDFFIEFLKNYSSYSPLLTSSNPESLGGGYFLALGGFGCVVDPGHHFIDNFFGQGRAIGDIDYIFVTHFHDDHFADLPALLSLLFQWHRTNRSHAVSLFADQQTLEMFAPIIDSSPYIRICKRLTSRRPRWNKLDSAVHFRTMPTKHETWDESGAGIGLAFRIERDRAFSYLLVTGDTGWDEHIGRAYRRFKGENTTLVAHISSAALEDISVFLKRKRRQFYKNHLCVHGVCRMIEAVEPDAVVLSEVGEELKEVIDTLAHIIAEAYGITCRVCKIGYRMYL